MNLSEIFKFNLDKSPQPLINARPCLRCGCCEVRPQETIADKWYEYQNRAAVALRTR